MISAGDREQSTPLDLRIYVVEQRLTEGRRRIGNVVEGIRQRARTRAISPGMLTAAFGFGVLLQRSRDHRTLSLMTLLNAAYTSSSLVVTVSSWLSPASRAPAGGETELSGR